MHFFMTGIWVAALTVSAVPVVDTAPVVAGEDQGLSPALQSQETQAAARALGTIDTQRLMTEETYASEILGHIDILLPLASDRMDIIAALNGLRIITLGALGRDEEAQALSARVIAAMPGEALVYEAPFTLALIGGKPADALGAIEAASRNVSDEAGRAELHEIFDREMVFGVNRSFVEEKNDAARFRLAEALVALGWPGPGDRQATDFFRAAAAEGRLEKGDRAGAVEMARAIDTPDPLLDLLVAKKYDALFDPGFDREQRLDEALADHDRWTSDKLRAAPDDVEVVLDRVQFLRGMGRNADAYALAEPFLADMDEVAETGEMAFWLVNEAAYALMTLDRADEALALMAGLGALGIEEHHYLISMTINHAWMLERAGRHADSAALAIRLAEDQTDAASAYGEMWMWSTASCALASQGKMDEAEAWLAKLRPGADNNQAALSRALLCLDRMDEAERLLISRLEGDDPSGVLVALQNYEMDSLSADSQQTLRDRWDALSRRPAVQQAVAEVGHVLSLPLPRSYWGSY